METKTCTALILIDAEGNFVIVDNGDGIDLMEKWEEVIGGTPVNPTRTVLASFIVHIPKDIVVPVVTVPEEKVTVELK